MFCVSTRSGLSEQKNLGHGLKNLPGKLKGDKEAWDLRKDLEMVSPHVYISDGKTTLVTNSTLLYLLPGDSYLHPKGKHPGTCPFLPRGSTYTLRRLGFSPSPLGGGTLCRLVPSFMFPAFLHVGCMPPSVCVSVTLIAPPRRGHSEKLGDGCSYCSK